LHPIEKPRRAARAALAAQQSKQRIAARVPERRSREM
jgi:hypothetical protein